MSKPPVNKSVSSLYEATPIPGVASTYYRSVQNSEYSQNFPFWRLSLVETVKRDPKVRYGLGLLKSPIKAFTYFLSQKESEDENLLMKLSEKGLQFVFKIESEDKKAEELTIETFKRLWLYGLDEMLSAIEWGFTCCQVHYTKTSDGPEYNKLTPFDPYNVSVLVRDHGIVGAKVQGIPNSADGRKLYVPKVMWHVHNRTHNRFFGQSRLEWVLPAWHEKWTEFGARDIRRTWFMRDAYEGGTIRYPLGSQKLQDGSVISNYELANQIASKTRTGGTRIMPADTGNEANGVWSFEAASGNIMPTGLLDYPLSLDTEILEALGIPPEVIESGSSGLGAATGRLIPLELFYASLSGIVNDVIMDAQDFITSPLCKIRFGNPGKVKISKVVLSGQSTTNENQVGKKISESTDK